MSYIDLTDPTEAKSSLRHEAEKSALQYLSKAYPMFSWYISTSQDGSILWVRCMEFTDKALQAQREHGKRARTVQNIGFALPVSMMRYHDEWKKSLEWAGGELLERAFADTCTGEFKSTDVDISQLTDGTT